MEIIVKPYESRYHESVIDVLKHLWDFPKKERMDRFDWLYESNTNPSFREPLAVIAVNEDDEVIGFRGWVPGIVWIDGVKYVIARAADVVVAPKGRRQGVFSKMTVFSLSYLRGKGIDGILNLSSNSQSNPGYLKLGWKALVQLNIWYHFRFRSFIPLKDGKVYENNNQRIEIFSYIPKGLVIPSDEYISFSMNDGQLDWYANRPNKQYVTSVSYDVKGDITSVFVIDISLKVPALIYSYYINDIKICKLAFNLLCRRVQSRIISTWGWALSNKQSMMLHKIGFIQIPFYEKLKKKPPILIRAIGNEEDVSGWCIGNKDMRVIGNWSIQMIDNF
jgi:hypothetical protein